MSTPSFMDLINAKSGKIPEGKNIAENIHPKPTGKEGFLEIAKDYISPEKEISNIRSWITAAPKGLLEELGSQLRNLPGIPEELKKSGLVASEEFMQEKLNKLLPTKEDFASRTLKRGGKLATYAFGAPGSILASGARSLIGGFLGEGSKELGAPEWAQGLTESAAFGLPGFAKKIIPTKAQEAAVNFGRRMGMTEKEIAPVIQSQTKQKWLSKLIPKRGKTQKALKATKVALGNIYDRLKSDPIAKNVMTPQDANTFATDINTVAQNLPARVRDLVQRDALELARKGFTGENLINFWQDITDAVMHSPGGEKLGILKEPISKALTRISPQLGEDFLMTNKLYSNWGEMAGRLKPTLVGDLMTAGRAVRLMLGITTGNLPLLIETTGEAVAKRIGREMLINPRFQNLGKQMVRALNENKQVLVIKLAQKLGDLIRPIDKEAANEVEDFKFPHQNKK